MTKVITYGTYLNVRNNVQERVETVKATGYADEVIIEDYRNGEKITEI